MATVNSRLTRRRFFVGLGAAAGLSAAGLLVQACGGGATSGGSTSATQQAPPSGQNAQPTAAPTSAPTSAAAAQPTAQGGAASAGQLKISYWGSFSGDNGKAEQELANRFNKSQDKIVLDYQFQGSYE